MPEDPNQQTDTTDPDRKLARYMFISVWVILLAMGYFGAQRWLEKSANLNASLVTEFQNGKSSVHLRGNRYGHYIATGSINGNRVVFLVDTGATSISIPEEIAKDLGLRRGRPAQVTTANGLTTVYGVTLDSVSLGELERNNVRAHINPNLPGHEILLGMSYLRHFELRQRAETLTIQQP